MCISAREVLCISRERKARRFTSLVHFVIGELAIVNEVRSCESFVRSIGSSDSHRASWMKALHVHSLGHDSINVELFPKKG